MSLEKFVIWGIGERGKVLTEVLEETQIIAYIDMDKTKQGKFYCNHPIISIEEYQEKFSDYFIIVTPNDEDPILNELHKRNIKGCFRMSQLPSEMQGYGDKKFLNKIEIPVVDDGNNVIWGTTLYSYLIYNKIIDMGYKNVYLFTQEENEKVRIIREKLQCKFISKINREKDNIILTTAEEKVKQHFERGITDLFDVSDLLPQYYNRELENFHNIHRGERCFIVATGPSLREIDLSILSEHKEICFSFNRIFNIDEKLWKPNYYLFTDRIGMKQYWEEIASYDVAEKFLGDSYWKDADFKGNIHVVHNVTGHSFDEYPRFSENIERKVYGYSTVTYAAIQLAVYMGFSTIYLLGVDCNYTRNSNKNYFFKDKKEDNFNHHENRMIMAYKAARKYADSHGIKILNATRGGMLEEFERVNFDDIFNS